MMAIDKQQLEAAIGRNAEYYLRRFEKIESGRRMGWNWAAFFLSTAWFSYRGLGGWAALNLAAPWLIAMAILIASDRFLALFLLACYPVALFLLVPMYADDLYYLRVKREIARTAEPGSKPTSPTRPVSAAIAGVMSILLPAMLVTIVISAFPVGYAARAQVAEAISLMSGARTLAAEYFADKGRWPDNLKQVAESTSGRYTERIEITSGAGAGSGALVMTATMRKEGVRSEVAGKTVQYRSEDGGKTWVCSRGAVSGVEGKYLPASCR